MGCRLAHPTNSKIDNVPTARMHRDDARDSLRSLSRSLQHPVSPWWNELFDRAIPSRPHLTDQHSASYPQTSCLLVGERACRTAHPGKVPHGEGLRLVT